VNVAIKNKDQENALTLAVKNSTREILSHFFNKKDTDNRNALMKVCDAEVVNSYLLNIIIANDPDVTSCDNDKRTPLHYAASNPKFPLDIFKTLLSLEGIDINAKDNQGNTPLYYACTAERVDLAKALLKGKNVAEAKVMLLDGNNEGKTPYDVIIDQVEINENSTDNSVLMKAIKEIKAEKAASASAQQSIDSSQDLSSASPNTNSAYASTTTVRNTTQSPNIPLSDDAKELLLQELAFSRYSTKIDLEPQALGLTENQNTFNSTYDDLEKNDNPHNKEILDNIISAIKETHENEAEVAKTTIEEPDNAANYLGLATQQALTPGDTDVTYSKHAITSGVDLKLAIYHNNVYLDKESILAIKEKNLSLSITIANSGKEEFIEFVNGNLVMLDRAPIGEQSNIGGKSEIVELLKSQEYESVAPVKVTVRDEGGEATVEGNIPDVSAQDAKKPTLEELYIKTQDQIFEYDLPQTDLIDILANAESKYQKQSEYLMGQIAEDEEYRDGIIVGCNARYKQLLRNDSEGIDHLKQIAEKKEPGGTFFDRIFRRSYIGAEDADVLMGYDKQLADFKTEIEALEKNHKELQEKLLKVIELKSVEAELKPIMKDAISRSPEMDGMADFYKELPAKDKITLLSLTDNNGHADITKMVDAIEIFYSNKDKDKVKDIDAAIERLKPDTDQVKKKNILMTELKQVLTPATSEAVQAEKTDEAPSKEDEKSIASRVKNLVASNKTKGIKYVEEENLLQESKTVINIGDLDNKPLSDLFQDYTIKMHQDLISAYETENANLEDQKKQYETSQNKILYRLNPRKSDLSYDNLNNIKGAQDQKSGIFSNIWDYFFLNPSKRITQADATSLLKYKEDILTTEKSITELENKLATDVANLTQALELRSIEDTLKKQISEKIKKHEVFPDNANKFYDKLSPEDKIQILSLKDKYNKPDIAKMMGEIVKKCDAEKAAEKADALEKSKENGSASTLEKEKQKEVIEAAKVQHNEVVAELKEKFKSQKGGG
jgi:ankyrin repeat protein